MTCIQVSHFSLPVTPYETAFSHTSYNAALSSEEEWRREKFKLATREFFCSPRRKTPSWPLLLRESSLPPPSSQSSPSPRPFNSFYSLNILGALLHNKMVNDDSQITHYRCTKCPNLILSAEDRAAHRAFHRETRETRESVRRSQEAALRQANSKKRPGPASRTLPGRKAKSPRVDDSVSVHSGIESLFERHEEAFSSRGQGSASLSRKDMDRMKGMLVDEPVDDDDPDSQSSRRHAALRKHIRQTPVFRAKYPGS